MILAQKKFRQLRWHGLSKSLMDDTHSQQSQIESQRKRSQLTCPGFSDKGKRKSIALADFQMSASSRNRVKIVAPGQRVELIWMQLN